MKTAVILSNMGGPDSLDDVEEYLYNIFIDPDIIDIPLPNMFRKRFVRWFASKRAPESREIYEQIGGSSPLLEITNRQANALEKALVEEETDFKVFVAMRYWKPFIEKVWQQITNEDYEQIVFVSMYPFYSSTTTGSLINEVKRLQAQTEKKTNVKFIDRLGSEGLFVTAMSQNIMQSIDQGQRKINLLLSTHSIPMKRIRKGDPYSDEVEAAANKLKLQLPDNFNVHLAYQSKIGPVKWLEPSTPEKIQELAKNGIKELTVYPFGFVADNSETIYEIGILYRDLAKHHGINKFQRINSLNDDSLFIELLKNKVLEAVRENRIK